MLMASASLEAARYVHPVNVTPSSSALQPSCNHTRHVMHGLWEQAQGDAAARLRSTATIKQVCQKQTPTCRCTKLSAK
jgi:hypothetical protein